MKWLVFFLVLVAPTRAWAFCRSRTTDATACNNRDAEGCSTCGLPLFWRGKCAGYSLQERASQKHPLATVTQAADLAFGVWNNVACPGGASSLTLSNLGPVACDQTGDEHYNRNAENQNVVVFRSLWPFKTDGQRKAGIRAATVALTTVTFDTKSGEIWDVDMELNEEDYVFSVDGKSSAQAYDLQAVLAHEAGHFAGLSHSRFADATMFADEHGGNRSKRTLSDDDRAGICAVYRPDGTRPVDRSVSPTESVVATACDPTPRHGFSSPCVADRPREEDGGCRFHANNTGRSAGPLLTVPFVVFALMRRRRQCAHESAPLSRKG